MADQPTDANVHQSAAAEVAALFAEQGSAPTIPGMPGEDPAPAAEPQEAAAGETPAAPAAEPSDEEVFGELDLGDVGVDDDEPRTPSGPPNPISDADIAEMRSILGEKSEGFTRDQLKVLHDKIIFGTEKGHRYRTAMKTVRDAEQALGREITSPDDILQYAQGAQTLDAMVSAVKSGEQGAAGVLRELMIDSRGQEYPWAQNIRNAARSLVSADLDAQVQSARTEATSGLVDTLAARAANHFANGEKDNGAAWLDAANRVNFLLHGEAHPKRGEIAQGRYERGASAPPAPGPQPVPSTKPGAPPAQADEDPEKARMRQEIEQYRLGQLRAQAESWGDQADGTVSEMASKALAPLKQLVDAGQLEQRIYDREVEDYVDRIYNNIGPELRDIGMKAQQAIKTGQTQSLSWLQGQFKQRVAQAVRQTRIEFLTPYKQRIVELSGRAATAQTRTKQAGASTEATGGGTPAAPTVNTKLPPGDRDGNAAWVRQQLLG